MPRVFWSMLAVFFVPHSALAENKPFGYDDVVDLARDVVQADMYGGYGPSISLIPQAAGQKDRIRLSEAMVYPTESVGATPEGRRVFDTMLAYVVENELYRPVFDENDKLRDGLKEREKIARKMYDVWASGKVDAQKLEALRELKYEASEVTRKAFAQYATAKGYSLWEGWYEGQPVAKPDNKVTLETSPPNGKICMMSATDYYIYKFQGADPDVELAKRVLPAVKGISMSGKYFYMIIWADGRKSGVGKIHLQGQGTFKLSAPAPAI